MNGYFRAQTEILADVQAERRDTGADRWTAAEIYRALNRALDDWQGRVSMPMVYTITGGYTTTTDTYALPAYIHGHVQPQVRFTAPYDDNTEATWGDLRTFSVEPDGTGGTALRVRVSGNGLTTTTEGRVLWYAQNSRVPLTAPALSAGITAADTSLTVNAAVDVGDCGYVKIDAEWLSYSGVTRGPSTVVLLNLERGLNSSTAAIHNIAATVNWAIFAPNMRLFSVLNDAIFMHLHGMFLTDGSSRTTEHHERQMLYYEQRVRDAWRRHVPARSPSLVQPNTQV